MQQPTDIVLNGAGYMLVPGHYTRAQDGAPEGRTGRITFRDFFGGQRRHLQLERDRGFDGLNVGPALNGQGVEPWAQMAATVPAPVWTTLPHQDTKIPSAIVKGRAYFSLGSKIYECPASGAGWSAPVMKLDHVSTITDMCQYSSNGVLLTFGAAKDITWMRTSDAATTVLMTGERGFFIGGYAGYAVWNDARSGARPTYLRQVTGTGIDDRYVDDDVFAFVNAGAKLFAITRRAVYSYGGSVVTNTIANPAYTEGSTEPKTMEDMQWTGEWSPFFQQGVTAEADDYKVFEGYGGKIHAWVAGEMMEHNPSGDRAGWRATGLSGRRCYGGTVAGGFLVVSIETWEGMNEIWAWDGSGWWRIAQKAAAATGNWCWPMNINNAGSRDILLFRSGEQGLDLLRLQHRSPTVHAFAPSAQFVTPMIDAGERDKNKVWRKVGAVFASPERFGNLASTDNVAINLEYSIDAGQTWTNVYSKWTDVIGTAPGNNLSTMNFTADAVLPETAVSRFLMIRQRWGSVADWAPILVGLWAEFEILDSPTRRRRWNFQVIARDQTVDRGGSLLTRTGRQLIAELWQSWQTGTTVAFRDLDYDADPTQRQVRIVGISESVPKPSDQGMWGDSVITLQLVEV